MQALKRYLPILDWGREYNRSTLSDDLIAAVIVTIMLIPQSLAYALVAGLPAQVGLYASMLPLVAYALFGTSRALAVGPVAVASLMTAAAASSIAEAGTPEYYTAAIALAMISGLILAALGLFKLGFLANFLSHPVISGFITASGVLIATSQIKSILGVKAGGENFIQILGELVPEIPNANTPTVIIGLTTTAFLFWVRSRLKALLLKQGVAPRAADIAAKVGPVVAIAATTLATWSMGLDESGVSVVGDIPAGLPDLVIPEFSASLWQKLLVSSLLIAVVGFVESVSVGQTLAARRRQRIDPDQELIALGASSVASAISGGYPVTGGFSRSVVNFDAGARTPAAGLFTAVGIAAATLWLTPFLFYLPKATLAATIVVAVLSIVDVKAFPGLWKYSKSDFAAMLVTILVTLGVGVDAGIVAGVALSIGIFLFKSSRPHTAVVGLIPGSQYFRNVERYDVLTAPNVLSIRIDASLFFANARFLEDTVYDMVASDPQIEHVILVCSSVNRIDASAVESLEAINERLRAAEVTFNLSAVKGPILDNLVDTHFAHELNGKIYPTQYAAYEDLAPDVVATAKLQPATSDYIEQAKRAVPM